LPYSEGKRCVVLAYDDKDDYGGIVFIDMNEDDNITNLVVSINSRYHFKLDEELKHESIFDGWEKPDTVAIPITARAKFHGFLSDDVYPEDVVATKEEYITYKDNINNFLCELDDNVEEIEPSILENIFAYLFAKAIESKYSSMLYKVFPEKVTKIVSYSIGDGLNGDLAADVDNEEVEKKIRIAHDYGKQFYKDYIVFARSNLDKDPRVILEQALTIVQQIGEIYAQNKFGNLEQTE
jgi:hypothetical protein